MKNSTASFQGLQYVSLFNFPAVVNYSLSSCNFHSLFNLVFSFLFAIHHLGDLKEMHIYGVGVYPGTKVTR